MSALCQVLREISADKVLEVMILSAMLCNNSPLTRGKTLHFTFVVTTPPFGQFFRKNARIDFDPSLHMFCGGVRSRLFVARITVRLLRTPRDNGNIRSLLLHTFNLVKFSSFPKSSGSSFKLLNDTSSFSSLIRCVNDEGNSFSLLWLKFNTRI